MTAVKRIVMTVGEPAGIGPDIIIQAAQKAWDAELIVVADPHLLSERAKQLNCPLNLVPDDTTNPVILHKPSQLKIIPISLKTPVSPGKLEIANAAYVIQCLARATDLCLNKKADALVTGPVQKSILNDAKIHFTGHTEYLGTYCHAPQTMMLFVVDQLKVALATTHLPLSEVPRAITTEKLVSLVTLLHETLQQKFHLADPKILVCGLNPHAGENGHLGREEIDVITPALEQLRALNIKVLGPLPADTVFTKKYLNTADAILAMYHDQALPVVKYIAFDHAVNLTLGLPIIRTSVDHGTALDLAGTKKADAGSLCAAIQLAINLSKNSLISIS